MKGAAALLFLNLLFAACSEADVGAGTTLRLVTPHAYSYVEDGLGLDGQTLEPAGPSMTLLSPSWDGGTTPR